MNFRCLMFSLMLLSSLLTMCGRKNEKVIQSSKESVEVEKEIPPFSAHVYFENSYSMNGYLGSFDLKATVYNLLVNMEGISDSLHYSYINSIVIPSAFNSPKTYSNGLTNDVFNSLGGDRGSTDIAEVLKNVLNRTDKDHLSILISDFEVSPPKTQDQAEYLKIQQVGLKDAFLQLKKKEHQDLAVAVFKMQAEFNGIYYSSTSGRISLENVKRPYYIWIIGTNGQIKKVMHRKVVEEDAGYLNSVLFTSETITTNQKFRIHRNQSLKGKFSIRNSREVQKAETEDQRFEFQVAVDFSKEMESLSYFNNSKHYQLSNPAYSVDVQQLTDLQKAKMKLSKYTHLLTFTTNKLINEDLEISILDIMPEWIAESNSTNTDSIAISKVQQSQTFGIRNLLEGVKGAYNKDGKNQIISQFKIKISR